MNDKVFGELKYDLFWSKQIVVQFNEKDVEITLMIDGEDDGLFEDEQYPPIESTTQLFSHITITGLMIPWPGGFEYNTVGLTFDCTWDVENGIGVLILDIFKSSITAM